ncbi:MAG: alpha/beta hydrolase family protein [Gammaproteobacteria bacterium]|nr:alpha/beta hydrolase family protein [Gammaproteobacteria bacterium]
MKIRQWALVLPLALFSLCAGASDLAKEKRWADQIVDDLIDGDALWLEARGVEFLSIYTPAQEPAKGSVILMHGVGVHPNWPQVIYPLRVQLAERGWHTLSLQMPILANEAGTEEYLPLMDEVAPRIEAGVAALKDKGLTELFLIGHSLGTGMARHYLIRSNRPEIKGLVAIGMQVNREYPDLNSLEALANISIPVLDLYGEHDLAEVLDSAADRKRAGESGNSAYSQVMVPGADHFFDGSEALLVNSVENWLSEHSR